MPDVMLVEESLKAQAIDYSITHYKDGVEALHALTGGASAITRPDLIVLDLNMPRMNGLELLQSLRSDSQFGNIPIVILTSSLRTEEKERARKLGATRFVRKPIDLYDFLDEVGRMFSDMLRAPGSKLQ